MHGQASLREDDTEGLPTAVVAANGLLWQQALQNLIATGALATVVGTASNLGELRRFVQQHEPQAAVIRFPLGGEVPRDEDTEDLLRIREEHPQLALVLLWPRNWPAAATLFPLVTSGRLVVLTSDSGAAEMRAALLLAAAGWTAIAPKMGQRIFPDGFQPKPQPCFPADVLSEREHDLLERLAGGWDEDSIAVALNVSPRTVQSHLVSVRKKLGAVNRTHAVALALQSGLISCLNKSNPEAQRAL